jgi:uncharacterized protein with HEPN domain
MSRRSKLFLHDIAESCEKIRIYTAGMSIEQFAADNKSIDAVVRNLEIIGEAVKNLLPDIAESNPEIQWKKIARFRDIAAHHYFKVNLEIVWDIIANKIVPLEEAVSTIISERPDDHR